MLVINMCDGVMWAFGWSLVVHVTRKHEHGWLLFLLSSLDFMRDPAWHLRR